MTWQIELREQTYQPTLSIRVRTRVEDLPKLIGESYHKIAAYIDEIGEKMAGAPFTAYYNLDMQDLDVEMGFPVVRPLPGNGPIIPGAIPEGPMVSCIHKGPYSSMEPMYQAMTQWIEEHHYEPVGTVYEVYFNSPGEVPESELLTRVDMPVKKK